MWESGPGALFLHRKVILGSKLYVEKRPRLGYKLDIEK